MEEKEYTKDGFLIVSELYRCPLWEKAQTPRCSNSIEDCFFCKFSDFRMPEYIQRQEESPQKGALYSVCHHEKNKKQYAERKPL